MEILLQECHFVTLTRIQPETVLRYIEGFVKNNPHFKFHGFLVELEKTFNRKRKIIVSDFSNYSDILQLEQLQVLYAALSENEILGFIQTFFSFTLDTDAIFIHLLVKYWKELKNPVILNTFLAVIKNSFFSESFEFGLECFDLKEQTRYLLLDIRPLWVFGLKYLAENSKAYEELMQEFSSVYHEVSEKQHDRGYCALTSAD